MNGLIALPKIRTAPRVVRARRNLCLGIAGFGAAAGRSPHALQNLGAGFLAGAQALDTQRQSLPEIRLKNAQAAKAEAEAGAYPALKAWSQGDMLNHLSGRIDAVRKDMASAPTTAAIPAPGGSIAPLPSAASANNPAPVTGGAASPTASAAPTASGVSLTPDQQRLIATLDQRRAYIDAQIDHYTRMPTGGLPNLIEAQQKTLSTLWAARQQIDQQDPRIAAAGAAMTEAAKNPAMIDRAGGEARAREANTFHTVAPGHYAGIGTNLQGYPEAVTQATPTGGETRAFVTPPAPGALGSTQQSGVITKQPPAVMEQQTVAATEYKETNAAAQKAQESRLPLQAIENALGTFRSGPSGETRLALGRAWQDFAQTVGLPENSDLAKWIASGEVVNKEGTRLGYELAKTLGSREAAMIVQQAIKSNPSLFNSPAGNQQIIGLIRAGLQREEDKRSFFDNWIASPRHGGSFVGASQAFGQAMPAERYINAVVPPRRPPQGVPQGSAYSPSRGLWRDAAGRVYNAAGVSVGAQ